MKKVYESTAAHTLFLCPGVNPRVSIKLCRNGDTPCICISDCGYNLPDREKAEIRNADSYLAIRNYMVVPEVSIAHVERKRKGFP